MSPSAVLVPLDQKAAARLVDDDPDELEELERQSVDGQLEEKNGPASPQPAGEAGPPMPT